MKVRVLRLRLIILLAFLGTVLLVWVEATGPIQDDFLLTNKLATGTSELRNLNVGPLEDSLLDIATNASQVEHVTLTILAPDLQFSVEETTAIGQFVRGGGYVLLADNFGVGNALLELLGAPIRFGNATILDDLFYERAYDFPLVYDLSATLIQGGVKELVLNRAVPLVILDEQSVTVLGRTSPFSFADMKSNGERDAMDPRGPFPVFASVSLGRGILYVFSSPGSLTNGMLNKGDNAKLVDILAHNGERKVLLEQNHRSTSASTRIRLSLQRFFQIASEGKLDQPTKVTLMGIGAVAMVAWLAGPNIEARFASREPPMIGRKPRTIEEILHAHPAWKRERLEYVEREIHARENWRGAKN